MFTLFESLAGFLLARLLWDAVRHYSRRAGMLPLKWALQVAFYLSVLFLIYGSVILALVYICTRSH